jgi:hypothetical protein
MLRLRVVSDSSPRIRGLFIYSPQKENVHVESRSKQPRQVLKRLAVCKEQALFVAEHAKNALSWLASLSPPARVTNHLRAHQSVYSYVRSLCLGRHLRGVTI